jgi:hypothetical protein
MERPFACTPSPRSHNVGHGTHGRRVASSRRRAREEEIDLRCPRGSRSDPYCSVMSDRKEMKSRASAERPDAALPPKLRRELAARALLGALDEYVREVVRVAVSEDDWIDQHASPLGKRAHLEAVRRGDLRGTKHGRRVLVRRSELDSFLESHPARNRKSEIERSDGVVDQARATEVAAKILADMGLRLRPG